MCDEDEGDKLPPPEWTPVPPGTIIRFKRLPKAEPNYHGPYDYPDRCPHCGMTKFQDIRRELSFANLISFKWIPTTEKLPPKYKKVLVRQYRQGDYITTIGCIGDDDLRDGNGDKPPIPWENHQHSYIGKIDSWMDIPE